MKIKQWIRAAWLASAMLAGLPASAQITITDETGRTVRLEKPAERIILSEPGDFAVLAMLDDNPARRIVAWNRWRLDVHTLAQWRSIDPAAFDKISQLRIDGPQNLSAEMLISHQPDLVILDHFFGKATQTISRLEQAGIPVAVLTLEADLHGNNPTQGMEALATLIGREARGKEIAGFIRRHLARVNERVAQAKAQGKPAPVVLMEPHAGSGPCCMSVGKGTRMGDLVALAGGKLIGDEIVEGLSGQLNPEYVIARDPDIYIGTGGRHIESRGGLLFGPGVDAAASQASLQRIVKRVGLAQTRAVRDGRAYGIWHSGSPIVNLELVASWIHPELFKDIDPAATQAAIDRYMAKRLDGTFWTALPRQDKGN